MSKRAPLVSEEDSNRVDTAHAGLTREDVVAKALELVELNGKDALSMRKLAAELGVTTNTIYWHVGSSAELHVAVISMMAERLGTSEVVGDTEAERIVSAAMNIWTNALEHRNVTALATQIGATTLLELPLEVALLAELEAAGVTGDAARDALHTILCALAGFLVIAWRPNRGESIGTESKQLWATIADPRVSESTKSALTTQPDLSELLESALITLVEAVLL